MDMIRVIGWWPRVYTSQPWPKINRKWTSAVAARENVGSGCCGDGEQNLEKEFEF